MFIIGGPNGAGKTTSAMKLLPVDLQCREFVNADTIAAGLSPFEPASVAVQAGKLMLTRIHELAERKVDFAFETTLAARSFAPFLRDVREKGFEIHLLYLWLPSVDLALSRIASRVRRGGHDIPEQIVRRRYIMGLRNFFQLYMPLADNWTVYDNSGAEPKRVAYLGGNGAAVVEDSIVWNAMRETL
jgi:predicted ABC-type ATPase